MNGNSISEGQGLRIHLTGVVQGVGFRPFVYGLAQRYALAGWVRNSSSGVDIEIDGPAEDLAAFTGALTAELPPLARIDRLEMAERPANGFTHFDILASKSEPDAFQPISPDMCICPDCLRELFDPTDRRYRYPFINCTNCGPRYTIIRDIPYDRPLTTMAGFALCAECAAEYSNPLDRRFHAQPVACPSCGPRLQLEYTVRRAQDTVLRGNDALEATRDLLREGRIVAVKGLGGYHLACDATDPAAVRELRRRKLRVDKPFAIMMADVDTVQLHCYVNEVEKELLLSRARPIVILARRPDSSLALEIAPGQDNIGVMLPYTPLHYLLLEHKSGFPDALVMTSGNLSEEPIAYTNDEARERLAGLADALLLHDRDIHARCDDSVMRVWSVANKAAVAMPLRRSRGYAPFPVKLPWAASLLATGGELKNTFCLVRDHYAFLSPHIGDMENYETLCSFEEGVAHMERLFRLRPEALVCDLHPNYMASRYARERAAREGLLLVEAQHHHAHVAAGMAEHGLSGERPVIGVTFDGTGYGDDGAIWGGEFLIADYTGYERAAHLRYVPLPGGDLAVREPWRMALAHLRAAGLPWAGDLAPMYFGRERGDHYLEALDHQIERGLNAPATSSMGRLFDTAAALAGVRMTVNYEAQAAIEFEALVDGAEEGAYSFDYANGLIDPAPAWAALLEDRQAGIDTGRIAARFHYGVAHLTADVCRHLRDDHGLNEVVLSGGVWQNVTLLGRTLALLEQEQFIVYTHHLVPANDGGLALGQAIIGAKRLANDRRQAPAANQPRAAKLIAENTGH
ncbi:MAG: carbamoyltransferase HypF [Candidatus Promineofilum sp.]|nr:carbamoyltransferase HypF [Promineifilum sp.]